MARSKGGAAAAEPATASPARRSRRKAQLAVVKEPAPQPEPTGDPTLTQEAVANWNAGQQRCRGRRRHNWNPFVVYERRTSLEVVEQCGHCRNRRAADFVVTDWGLRQATTWKAAYRDGYLLPKGAAQLDETITDQLTAADIRSRRTVEVPDEDGDE